MFPVRFGAPRVLRIPRGEPCPEHSPADVRGRRGVHTGHGLRVLTEVATDSRANGDTEHLHAETKLVPSPYQQRLADSVEQ